MSINTDLKKDLLELWVGLDLAKKTFVAAICFESKARSACFATSEVGVGKLLAWCDDIQASQAPNAQLRFVMEATGCSSVSVFNWLYKARQESAPAVINPHYIRSFGQSLGVRNKTDKADAKVIAQYGAERKPAGDLPRTEQEVKLLKFVREREVVVEECTAEKNRDSEPCDVPEIKELRAQRIEFFTKQIKTIELLLKKLVAESPELKKNIELLDTIPGVGFIVATTVIAELGDLRRFKDPRKLAAYAGMSPSQFTSGTSVRRRTKLCKKGNKHVRPKLVLAARSLIGKAKFAYGRLYEELVSRGKTKKAAIAAVGRKILVMMRAVLISQKPYCDETVGCGKLPAQLWKSPEENLKAA